MPFEFTLTEAKPEELNPNLLAVVGSAPGKLLRFQHAVLARTEVNANRDELTREGLEEVARTLPLMAIDLEHRMDRVVGFFTDARVLDDALDTDGIVFADRFPEVASGIMDGSHRFSIEAEAQEAVCSVCGSRFVRENTYCAHLSNRKTSGAVRRLKGLAAKGGGITRMPAGTNTTFDPQNVALVASVTLPEPPLTFLSEMEFRAYVAGSLVTAKPLTSEKRSALPNSAFALIQKKDGKTLRRFPINDCNHARNALSRLSGAKGLSEDERAQVKSKAEAILNSDSCKTETRASAMRAAQVLAQKLSDPNELIKANPESHIQLASPVLSPMARPNEDPAWVAELAQKVAASLAVAAAQPSVPEAYMKAVQDLQAQITALEARLTAREKERVPKVEAAQTQSAASRPNPGTGIRGLAFDPPAADPAQGKVTAKWR